MATTKEKVKLKVIELLNDSIQRFEEKTNKLLNSGVIDFENEDDDWGLPKDIVQALAMDLSWQYKRPKETKADKKRILTYNEVMKWYN